MDIGVGLLSTEGGNVGDVEGEEELLKEGRRSVEIVSALDLSRPGREVGLDSSEAADVEAVEETFFGVIAGDVSVEVEVDEAAARAELLLCCVRCCGRDVTLNDD